MGSNLNNNYKDEMNKSAELELTGSFILFLGTLILLYGIITNYSLWFILGGVFLLIIGAVTRNRSKKKQIELDKIHKEENVRLFSEDYIEKKKSYNIPINSAVVKYEHGHADIAKTYVYMWIDKDELHFFPTDDVSINDKTRIKLHKIPLDKIEYYTIRGEIVHENQISGGGGGGSSVIGALVGGAIAGSVGAIIGSRKEVEPIKSELITHDNRETFLEYFDDINVKHSMIFNYEAYNVFNELLPEKAYDIVNTIKTNAILNKAINQTNPSSNIIDQIRELAKLKDEGILTEQEFEDKKKVLLDKLG